MSAWYPSGKRAVLRKFDRPPSPLNRAVESGAGEVTSGEGEDEEGSARVERRVPLIPFSREVGQFHRLKRSLALYRLVFGQPRQEDLLAHLAEHIGADDVTGRAAAWRISLAPPAEDDVGGSDGAA